MAGHSQFKNIMYRKGAQDKKRAKLFAKLIREVTVAAKWGLPEPDKNPRLRAAVAAARAANMPKDNVDRAIKRVAGGEDAANFEEIRYEGYGPGGIAVIVETLTDNRNRTASEVRAAFSKFGGTLGETGSVAFLFERVGVISFDVEAAAPDAVFEAAVEAGANDVDSDTGRHEITCDPEQLASVRDSLAEQFGDPNQAYLGWKPHNTIEVGEDQAETLIKLLETLDDNDDVQQISANFEIADDVMSRLTA